MNILIKKTDYSTEFDIIFQNDIKLQECKPRADYIKSQINISNCYSVYLKNKLTGYYIFNSSFYHRPFLDLLYIFEQFRNNKIGEFILKKLLSEHSEQFFTSTNLSNSHMLHLLHKTGFYSSGIIYNLDKNDPEVIFTNKQI